MSHALIFGGSGTVGQAVVRALAASGLSVRFTYLHGEATARALAEETGATALRLDLRDAEATRAALAAWREPAPRVFVHCAAKSQNQPLAALSLTDWEELFAINCRAAFLAAQALAPAMQAGGEIILLGAMDRAQSLPAPVHFAATQGALATMTVALAKELGPQIRVNLVALGPLDQGLSRELSPKHLADYRAFSALRRLGNPQEIASVVCWLATENRYISGKTIPVNGGI